MIHYSTPPHVSLVDSQQYHLSLYLSILNLNLVSCTIVPLNQLFNSIQYSPLIIIINHLFMYTYINNNLCFLSFDYLINLINKIDYLINFIFCILGFWGVHRVPTKKIFFWGGIPCVRHSAGGGVIFILFFYFLYSRAYTGSPQKKIFFWGGGGYPVYAPGGGNFI